MKKILLGLMLVGSFFISGCESEDDIDESKPYIEIIGDARIVIGVGDDYVDQGANIIGDFDVELRTIGEVDTSTIGSYMIEYSVVYEEEFISKTRTVLVTTQTEADFGIRLEYIGKTSDSLSFIVTLQDDDGNLRNSVAKLYQGETVVGEIYYGNGNNLLKFENLDPNTYYQVLLEGSFTEGEETYSIGEYGVGITTLEAEDFNDLEITLNGDEFMTIVVGSDFEDPGAYVDGNPDIEITTVSNVNTSIPGNYHIVYTATENDEEFYAFRQITVVEEVDLITVVMRGEASMNINLNEMFIDPGAYVVGYSGEAIAIVTAESTVDIYTPGQYEIVYSTTIDGVVYTATREVNVLPVWSISGLFLNGDYDMTIGLYKSFEDPGAFYIGDPTVEITAVSDINLYVVGDYTIVYTAVVDGVTHTVTRIVHVVEETYDSVEVIIIGDTDVTINVNEYFLDPGAFYVGTDEMLLIMKNSNLDNTTPGDYTITYSVVSGGVTYSATRTIHVIALEIPDFNVSITLDDITPYSLTYTITINDPDGVLAIANAQLYNGEDLVSYVTFENGSKSYTFIELSPDTTYTLVLDGQYMEDGYLTSFGNYELSGTTEAIVDPVITLDSYDVGVQTFNAVLTVTDDYNQIESAKLRIYDFDTDYLVAEEFLTRGFNDVTFMFLQAETTYKAVIEYGYFESGNWWTTDIVELALTFTTEIMPKPVITDYECNTDNDDIICSFEFDETGFDSGVTYFAQLIEGGYPIQIYYLDDNELIFEDLATNTDYSVKIFSTATVTETGYTYTGDIGLFSTPTEDLLTDPTIENVSYTVTPHSVTVDFTVVDWDFTFEDGYLRLLNGWSVVEDITIVSNGHHSITFETDVESNYDFVLEYRINFDNGNVYDYDNFEVLLREYISTPPEITVLDFNGAKTYFDGDNLVLSIALTNDDDYDIDFVTIDGEVKEVFKFPSNNELIFIDMGPVSEGINTYVLNNIGISLNDGTYLYNYEQSTTIQIYAPYAIDPEYAVVVPLDFTTSEVGGSSFKEVPEDGSYTTINLYIHLENEYALTVTGLGLYGYTETVTNFEIISPTLIRASVEVDSGNNIEGVTYIEYDKNGTTVRDTYTYGNYTVIFGYKASEAIAVGTVSEFLAINGNNHYYLTNDIDFGGIDIDPLGTFEDGIGGSFNGNGYALTNFNINADITGSDSYEYIGLFGYSAMFMADYQIANASINVTTTDDSNFVYVGFIAGSQQNSVINVDVNASTINVTGFYKGTIGGSVGAYYDGYMDVFKDSSANVDITVDSVPLAAQDYSLSVGGLIGYNNDGNILHSYSKGTINVTNTNLQAVYTGGLVGYMRNGGAYDSPSYILNSYADVDINTSGTYTGGLLGAGSDAFDQFVWLENVFALGDIHADRGKVGGLVGYNVGKLVNGFATGNVDNTGGSVGYLIGYNYGLQDYRISNSFRYDGQLITNYGSISNGTDYYWEQILTASSYEYNSEEFYTEVVGLSTYFFDFGLLSVESDLLPVIN